MVLKFGFLPPIEKRAGNEVSTCNLDYFYFVQLCNFGFKQPFVPDCSSYMHLLQSF